MKNEQHKITIEHNESNDCAVRALTLASGLSYMCVHSAWQSVGRKNNHRVKNAKRAVRRVFKLLDIKAIQVKRSGTVRKFIMQHREGNYFVLKTNHCFAIINGNMSDNTSINSRIIAAWKIKLNMEA